ncbi:MULTISPECIES: hypothetical protein [Clostridia]|jgi:hypothetical protein|uniref:hypothetical protein n=1 Tax=Clostridia TaxID=186801 RepID=UPI001A9C0443|nr:hypothetical protein [Clostridium sp. 1001270J_160509_D11]
MTMIYVNTEKNRFSIEQRRELAQSLTDAVLIPEIGQLVPGARRNQKTSIRKCFIQPCKGL